MEKFIMSEIPDNQQVVLDVPVGHLRMRGNILRDGAGEMVFAIADESATIGDRVRDYIRSDALRIICQTPEKAETIAQAFLELAADMREAIEAIEESGD